MAKAQGVLELATAAKAAARHIAGASTGAKNAALLAYARRLETEGGPVLEANARDLAEAKRRGFRKLFVLTTRATHWFIERGFSETAVTALPKEKKELYNYQRRSKILAKRI